MTAITNQVESFKFIDRKTIATYLFRKLYFFFNKIIKLTQSSLLLDLHVHQNIDNNIKILNLLKLI